jgi:uncharacterized protein YcfJ
MNKSMLMGLVGGIGLATAGGVLGYQYLGERGADVGAQTEQDVASTEAPATRTAAAPAARPTAAPAQECWDEEVQVTADPKDEHRIAGTAIGAVVGGAIGKEINDSDFATAAGAAAGALIGRKAQGEFQENREATRTTTAVERRCGPAGSAPR